MIHLLSLWLIFFTQSNQNDEQLLNFHCFFSLRFRVAEKQGEKFNALLEERLALSEKKIERKKHLTQDFPINVFFSSMLSLQKSRKNIDISLKRSQKHLKVEKHLKVPTYSYNLHNRKCSKYQKYIKNP